jgi:hypothetical protein
LPGTVSVVHPVRHLCLCDKYKPPVGYYQHALLAAL